MEDIHRPPPDVDDDPAGIPDMTGEAVDDETNDDSGFVPSWASKATQKLHVLIQNKEQRLERRSQDIHDCRERSTIMSEHLKNVQEELVKTQGLLDAKAKAIESEDHMKRIAVQELSRLRADKVAAEKETRRANEKIHSMQNDLFAANEKIERFMTQQHWNEEELEQWLLATKQNDDDAAALARYKKQDDVRLKTASMTIEQLTKESYTLKRELDLEATETISAQIELDRMAVDFREIHLERQEIVQKWEEAQKLLVKRDVEIRDLALGAQQLKMQLRQTRDQIGNTTTILEQERANNQTINLTIKTTERGAENARLQLQDEQQRLKSVETEAETKKRELQDLSALLHQAQQGLATDKHTQREKLTRLDAHEKKIVLARERLQTELTKANESDTQSQVVEKLYNEAFERNQAGEKQLQILMGTQYKHNQDLFQIRKAEANTISMMNGAHVALRNVQAKISELDQRSIGQQEMMYGIEFQLQQMERKVARASGKRTFNEKVELTKKLNQLTAELDQERIQETSMSTHLKTLIGDVDKCQKRLAAKTNELQNLNEGLNERLLENQTAERELAAFNSRKDDMVLQCDLLRLDSKQLREKLLGRLDQVYFLENRKHQLKLEMEEREKQLVIEEGIIKSELRLEEERRHKVALEVKERELKIETLRNKYDAIAGKLRGAEGRERSQAYYIIQAAQQKEELVRAGDVLNSAIRTESRNLRLLNLTRSDLKSNNNLYRESLQKADEKGADAISKNKLNEKKKSMEDILNKKKMCLREMQADYDDRTRLIAEMEDDVKDLHQEVLAQDKICTAIGDKVDALSTKNRTTLNKIRELSESGGRPEPDLKAIQLYLKQRTEEAITAALDGSIAPALKL